MPQSLNRYSYVQNDPVNYVDPTGLDDEVINVYTWAWPWNATGAAGLSAASIAESSLLVPLEYGGLDPTYLPPSLEPVPPDPIPPPFNITPADISRVRSLIANALRNSLCASFMSAFLNELGNVTGVAPFSNDPVAVFEKLVQTNSIQGTGEAGVMGRASGSTGGGNAHVRLNLNNLGNFREGTAGALHEITHVATGAGRNGYSHADMNQAAFNVLSQWGILGPQGLFRGSFDRNASYAGAAMDAFCRRR